MLLREDELYFGRRAVGIRERSGARTARGWRYEELQRCVVAEFGYGADHPRALEALSALRRAGVGARNSQAFPST